MNSPKRSLKRRALITCTALIGVCCISIFVFVRHASLKPSSPNNQALSVATVIHSDKPVKIEPGLPVRIKIPEIQVDAAIDRLGLTAHGDLDAPKQPSDAGWYLDGPRPGAAGSSVIDGHYGWVGGKPAVFDNLHTLRKGDFLYIEDEKGVVTKFIVSGSRLYGPNEDATAVFRTTDGQARLNLITCQGSWNAGRRSYANRLVVFSVKEEAL